MLYVDIVDIISFIVKGTQVGIGYTWIINGIGEPIAIGQIRPLFATVSEYGGSYFQFAIDTVVGFQRQVEAVVFYAFHIALFHIVA